MHFLENSMVVLSAYFCRDVKLRFLLGNTGVDSDFTQNFWGKIWRVGSLIYIMIELCFFSLDQWERKIHMLWGKSFNIPHWPRSHSTNRRLQHIEKVSKTYSGDPHLDQTKLNDLILLTIHGVLVTCLFKCSSISWIHIGELNNVN